MSQLTMLQNPGRRMQLYQRIASRPRGGASKSIVPNSDPKNPVKDRASRRRRYDDRQRFPKRLSTCRPVIARGP